MDPHVHVDGGARQPLPHGLGAHPLLVGHPLVVVDELQLQPVVVELRGLGHALGVVGHAGDQPEVAVDHPADPRGAADPKQAAACPPLLLRDLDEKGEMLNGLHVYSALIQSALHCCLTITHSGTRSHTDGGVMRGASQLAGSS